MMERTMRDHLNATIEALLLAEAQAERVREKADAGENANANVLLGDIRAARARAQKMRERTG